MNSQLAREVQRETSTIITINVVMFKAIALAHHNHVRSLVLNFNAFDSDVGIHLICIHLSIATVYTRSGARPNHCMCLYVGEAKYTVFKALLPFLLLYSTDFKR